MTRNRQDLRNKCRVTLAPQGCGFFPHRRCINPRLHLEDPGPISCEATITGRLTCDLQPVSEVEVTLSGPSFITFEPTSPITDNQGRFTSRVLVDPNTPIQPNTEITAIATVNGRTVSDTIRVSVECVNCTNAEITINPITDVIGCQGENITGTVTCNGAPVPNTTVFFRTEQTEQSYFIKPNPATTDENGRYTTKIIPPIGVEETITFIASTTVGGHSAEASIENIQVNCQECLNPVIRLNNPGPISCTGRITGTLTCSGAPISNRVVNLSSGSSFVSFNPADPITNENGRFTSEITISPNTPFQDTVQLLATARVHGNPTSDVIQITAGCVSCTKPEITLNTPSETVGCEGADLTGIVTCDGEPIPGDQVFFHIRSEEGIITNPNPATTDENGRYRTTLHPSFGDTETIMITASVTVGSITVETNPQQVRIDCHSCQNPIIELHDPGPISCHETINGRVFCDEAVVPNVEVRLSSTASFMSFSPDTVTTNEFGEFTTTVQVRFNTPLQEGVPITATATVNGVEVSNTNLVRAECLECKNPSLTLVTPKNVGCEGAQVTGRVTCEGVGVPNVPVFFDVVSSHRTVFIEPNPAITDENGNYTSPLIPIPGAVETVKVIASANVGGTPVSTAPRSVNVNCPPEECPCKFKLDTQGGARPGANIRVTRFGVPMDYTGTLNITVNQCGASPGGGCNPAVNNFNFTFNANNGDTFQFTQGRRMTISCEGSLTRMTVNGMIKGNVDFGPPSTFEATITATLNKTTNVITWEIFADDDTTTTFETITPFTAQGSPQSFIEDC